MFDNSKRVFLDYASTTPTDKRVISAMKPFWNAKFQNPSALYEEGVDVRKIIDQSRRHIANITQAKPSEIIFTGSGTESDNLAIIGVARSVGKKGDISNPHIITTNIEHVAVIESCKRLEKEGFEVTYLSVNSDGTISVDDIKRSLRPETILVSVMLANNEIGTIFPIRQIGVEVSKYKKEQNRISASYPYFHSDASQAPNYLDINVDRLGVDLLTLDGSKIYGPKGIGCLIAKSHIPMEPILYGGGQESGFRPGTENVPAIVGFTKALQITTDMQGEESERLKELQDYFIRQLKEEIPKAEINGSIKNRLPNNINICIRGLNAEFAVIQLDEAGVSCAAMLARICQARLVHMLSKH